MKAKNTAAKVISKAIMKAASKTTHSDAESACIWLQYQPEQPKALKKLRRR